MIRDLVKEEAEARAVRWAEMLPESADQTIKELRRANRRLQDEVWDLTP